MIRTILNYTALFLLLFGVTITSCKEENSNQMFRTLTASETGIDFSNNITETETFNILNFHYIYNGGGVGVADFDKNGLPDLVFSGNQVPSRIYLNQGELKFKDISKSSNFQTKGWATGISIVDINEDGWQDIYLSVGGYECDGKCFNQLFIHQGLDNNGLPSFKEMAADYGLEDGLYSQQAAFFDYDLDGDLDVYLLHNVIDKRDKNAPSEKRFINKKSKDQLLENKGNGQFENVSESLGITHRGYGLGITINDFNNDLLPDIYIANDFLSDDLMYLNQGFQNGKHQGFEEVGQTYLKHTSYNAMGVDVADVNNDALPDIFVLDMLPEYNERQKTMLGFMNYNKFSMTLRQGYSAQFIRNTLQVHNGFLGKELLPFSEVGYMAGVYNTDWSWTPLLADFDNDGDRDLYVTNGYGKDITDLDFINYSAQRNPFGTKATQEKELFDVIQEMESITIPNYIFENNGDLKFENRSGDWIKNQNSISNGAVYADLDNDGDLDLVVNNIDEPAFVLENQISKNTTNNYLKIKINGSVKNPTGIGAKIHLWTGGKEQVHFQSPVRGYLSTVEDVVHFGLGNAQEVDSLLIIFPKQNAGQVGHESKVFYKIQANQTFEIKNSIDGFLVHQVFEEEINTTFFQKVKSNLLNFSHDENPFQDFDAQPLLMHQHSKQGPCFAVANVDGKTGEELFIGGAKGFSSQIAFQNKDGSFRKQNLPHAECEDTGATFFDFDNDGDLDLYVVSGGSEFKADAEALQDRLYLNDGLGNFAQHENIWLPKSSGKCVIANDFDKDGDIDLFVGGRVIPRKYPQSPRSYLLLNHEGRFLDYTNKLAYPLENIGMVTDAVWSDYDGDGWDDLIIVGEWMSVTVFKNVQGHLEKHEISSLENSTGFWNCIVAKDMDGDGDDDYLLGNLGKNSRLQASENEPLAMYRNDKDENGSPDPLIGQFYLNKKGERKSYPIHARDDAVRQLVKIKKRFEKYSDFGNTTFTKLMGSGFESEDYLFATQLSSSYLENKGNGEFEFHELPQEVQVAPIQDILVNDFDGDGYVDALLSGNDFTGEKNNGWYDAFNGLMLRGNGKGGFESVPTSESGFFVPEDGREIVLFKDKDGRERIFTGQNSGEIVQLARSVRSK